MRAKINLKFALLVNVITSERSEQSFYQESYMGRLDDIQTALKPFNKLGKNLNMLINIYIFYIHSNISLNIYLYILNAYLIIFNLLNLNK